jgi:hypothetical protein
MKRLLLILSFVSLTCFSAFSQDDNDRVGRLQERMTQYIQKNLGLSKNEAEKFSPVFLRYILDLRRTHVDNRDDKIVLQQKIADLRVRYRNEFRQVLDEQRANKVFDYQRDFEIKIKTELQNRSIERPLRRNR